MNLIGDWLIGCMVLANGQMENAAATLTTSNNEYISFPVRARDTRMVGCTGDSQVVISNSDLEDLIVSVLDAIDSPVDVRTLRSLVMSRLAGDGYLPRTARR